MRLRDLSKTGACYSVPQIGTELKRRSGRTEPATFWSGCGKASGVHRLRFRRGVGFHFRAGSPRRPRCPVASLARSPCPASSICFAAMRCLRPGSFPGTRWNLSARIQPRRRGRPRDRPSWLDSCSAERPVPRTGRGRPGPRQRADSQTDRKKRPRLSLAVMGFEFELGRAAAQAQFRLREQHDGQRTTRPTGSGKATSSPSRVRWLSAPRRR